ncbi:MAG TPA: hemolysin-type calcium-binding protein [Gemmobacter sp.]|nr:MAG: hypothetical protein A2X69_19205 [Rhodobacteraceae bacterium GWF1_65_7]HBD90002.1 hemolysin-type calcium-binding protein [Gemmobacter sp.]
MDTGFRGAFVISWQQTETDGIPGADLRDVGAGSVWRWSGAALRVDGPDAVLLLGGDAGMADLHRRAGRVARRMLGLVPGSAQGAMMGAEDDDAPGALGRAFTVTDGRQSHMLTLISVPETGARLLLCRNSLPPRDRDLWVVRLEQQRPRAPQAVPPMPGLAPDARMSTPEGIRPLWSLRPGDRLLTRDSGAQEIVWMGAQRLQPARLQLMPGLWPVRLRGAAGDLRVSPSQRLLVRGAATEALFNSPEVLVAAADLCDGAAIRQDRAPREISYVQIMLDRHEIIYANGFGIGSYDPAEIGGDGFAPARRCLTAAEAAILQHDLAA